MIRSAQIRYRQEMRMDERYMVTACSTAFRTNPYSVHQQLWAGKTLRATLDCVPVLITPEGAQKHPIPEPIKHRFLAIDAATPP